MCSPLCTSTLLFFKTPTDLCPLSRTAVLPNPRLQPHGGRPATELEMADIESSYHGCRLPVTRNFTPSPRLMSCTLRLCDLRRSKHGPAACEMAIGVALASSEVMADFCAASWDSDLVQAGLPCVGLHARPTEGSSGDGCAGKADFRDLLLP